MEQQEENLNPLEKLGSRLRAMRVQAGLSGAAIAPAVGGQQSKVSRIEHGKQLPSPADIEAWATATGAGPTEIVGLLQLQDGARVWRASFRTEMSAGQVAVQKSYNEHVSESSLVRHLETVWVPGLLQIPEYTRRVLTEMTRLHDLQIDDVDAAVAERMQRQRFLYDPSRRFEFLLWEPVLRTPLPGYAAMRAQLDRLQTVIGLDRIRFGIIPLGVPLVTTPQNSVQVYVKDDGPHAVVETYVGDPWSEPAESAAYQRAIDLQWEDAAEGEGAHELILRAIRSLP